MRSFKLKLILTFLLYGLIIAILSVGIIYKFYSSNLKSVNIEKAEQKSSEIINIFTSNMDDITQKIQAITDSKIFKQYLESNKDEAVYDLFLSFANSSKNIMQLRFIDKTGQEKIRIDRKNLNSKTIIVRDNELQNKSNRYYFKEIFDLNGGFWYSNIDLNEEKGQIELPIKPTFRVGTVVKYQNKKVGILIINMFMEDILKNIQTNNLFNIYIIDKKGNFLLHPNSKYDWSKYLNIKYTIKDEFPEYYNKILSYSNLNTHSFHSEKLSIDNLDQMKIIVEPKLYYTKSQLIIHTKELIFLLLGIIILSIPIAYIFAKNPSKLKEEVDKFNETLEHKIIERTNKLNKTNKRLEKLATLDFLTQIPNRRYFFSIGKKYFAQARKDSMPLSIFILDIDYFKKINDKYGHKVGDEALILVAKTLKNHIRQDDIIARIGGEEFAILIQHQNLRNIDLIADKLRQEIFDTTFTVLNKKINLSISIGITHYKKNDSTLIDMYERADKALYQAKNAGRNCIKEI